MRGKLNLGASDFSQSRGNFLKNHSVTYWGSVLKLTTPILIYKIHIKHKETFFFVHSMFNYWHIKCPGLWRHISSRRPTGGSALWFLEDEAELPQTSLLLYLELLRSCYILVGNDEAADEITDFVVTSAVKAVGLKRPLLMRGLSLGFQSWQCINEFSKIYVSLALARR